MIYLQTPVPTLPPGTEDKLYAIGQQVFQQQAIGVLLLLGLGFALWQLKGVIQAYYQRGKGDVKTLEAESLGRALTTIATYGDRAQSQIEKSDSEWRKAYIDANTNNAQAMNRIAESQNKANELQATQNELLKAIQAGNDAQTAYSNKVREDLNTIATVGSPTVQTIAHNVTILLEQSAKMVTSTGTTEANVQELMALKGSLEVAITVLKSIADDISKKKTKELPPAPQQPALPNAS